MGTPEIAAYSLKSILESKHEVVGVVTTPDKPAGRGQKLQASAVKEFAIENNLTVLQPEKLKNQQFLDDLQNLRPDLIVVVAFRMLPKEVWSMPNFGTINLHASLLPQYRGAAPINWAIINGEKTSGVTTFFIDEKIDTGMIIKQKRIDIDYYDDAGKLHDKIMIQGAETLLETIDIIESGNYSSVGQDNFISNEQDLKPAPKIFKDDCKIDWSKNVFETYNFIRGMNPYPGAWGILKKNEEELVLKIFSSRIEQTNHDKKIGSIIVDKNGFKVAVNDGFMSIDVVRLQGKKTMTSADFIRGFDLSDCVFI